MKLLKCFAILICLTFILNASAQDSLVRFQILNSKKEPVAFASVHVIDMSDSARIQNQIADSLGIASFNLTPGLQYKVQISSVNFETLIKGIRITGKNLQFVFTLQTASKTLSNVVVTSTRPLIRQEDDKTIVDPENLAASSTNAYEIIEKTPGLFVDQDGNIYLSSMTPATVHINGREQKMSTADVATMLKSLPPNSIASIEILRTPSSKYDASGAGGIVNVVLKKGVRIGFTGSANAGFNQGRYGNRFAGLNLNNNTGALNTYLNLQYSKRNQYEKISSDRFFAADSVLTQSAFTKYPTNTYYLGYGIVYTLNKKWDLNYDGRISLNRSANHSENNSQIKEISTNKVFVANDAFVNNKTRNYNITQSASLKHKIDSAGSEWSTDVSYNYAPNNNEQLLRTEFSIPFRTASNGQGDIENKLHFFSAQSNLLKKLNHQLTVETGIKTTNVKFNNNTAYFRGQNGSMVKDPARTGEYQYIENIHALYLQGSKNIKGVILKLGTRLENTNMKGRQITPQDTSFSLKRTDLFPYVYISRNLMKIAGYDLRAYLVYRRTINRPAYEYLNPSIRFVDPYLFETGNPSLRPQFTQNYEANISVDERPIIAIGVNETNDIFTQVVYPTDSNRAVNFRTYDNLGKNKETYFRALGALPPGKKYFFVFGGQYNYNSYNGLYQNKAFVFKKGSWSIFTYHTLKLTPLTQLSLNGFARFNGQLQFYELSSFGSLNLSLTQQFLNKKLIATLSANDLFFTNNNEFTLSQGTVNAAGYREGDTRRFGLNLRYNFGFRKKEDNNFFNIESPERSN